MNSQDIISWRFIDQSTLGPKFSPLASFATDDMLCFSVGTRQTSPTIRTWVHHNTVVLGIQDSRLPFIKNGVEYLKKEGYDVIIRNSGGLAVVLDEGILNISLIFSEERGISINSGYEAMYNIIQSMFRQETDTIKAGEIVGSYCPGSYDLSINGKKFAGISQRRVRGGVAVQLYLCVNASGSERAALIKRFYEVAVQDASTKFAYPTIIPATMASLEELLGRKFTIQEVIMRLLQTIKHHRDVKIEATQLFASELALFNKNLERMKKRNEEIV